MATTGSSTLSAYSFRGKSFSVYIARRWDVYKQKEMQRIGRRPRPGKGILRSIASGAGLKLMALAVALTSSFWQPKKIDFQPRI